MGIDKFRRLISEQITLQAGGDTEQTYFLYKQCRLRSNAKFSFPLKKIEPLFLSKSNSDKETDIGIESKEEKASMLKDDKHWINKLLKHFASGSDIFEKVDTDQVFMNFYIKRADFLKTVLNKVALEKNEYGLIEDNKSKFKASAPTNNSILIDCGFIKDFDSFSADTLRSCLLGNFIKKLQYNSPSLPVCLLKVGRHTSFGSNIEDNSYSIYKEKLDTHYSLFQRIGLEVRIAEPEGLVDFPITEIANIFLKSEYSSYIKDSILSIDLDEFGLGMPIIQLEDMKNSALFDFLILIIFQQIAYGPLSTINFLEQKEKVLFLRQVFKILQLFEIEINELVVKHTGLTLFKGWTHNLNHICIGHINGLSTKNKESCLESIIISARDNSFENKIGSPELQPNERNFNESVNLGKQCFTDAETLGLSAYILKNFQSHRSKDFNFSWSQLSQSRGIAGIYIQYCHARLCGIERLSQITVNENCHYELLKEDVALDLASRIGKFPEVLSSSKIELDPSHLVRYLHELAQATTRVCEKLRVKGLILPHLADSRWMLLWCARTTLANGLRLLGISPLTHM